MSHRPVWQCSKCQHQLGEVVCGTLTVWAPKPMLGPESAAVECPRCGHPNVWRYVTPVAHTSAMMTA